WQYILQNHGVPPDTMLDNGKNTRWCFTKGSGEAWRLKAGNVPITSSFPDLLKRMLELDPDKRITPSEMLEHPFISTPHTHCADQEGASVDHSNSWSSESSVDHSNSCSSVDHPNSCSGESSVDHPNSCA
ncbi:hypothetical protein CRUP_028239, partial [Coryphaenoides rupestris]